MFFEKRDVFVKELFLKVLSAGGNHHAFARQDGGKQIGQRFPRARAGLDDQVFLLRERALHSLGHL